MIVEKACMVLQCCSHEVFSFASMVMGGFTCMEGYLYHHM